MEINELAENVLIVGLHGPEPGGHFIVTSGEVIDLTLKGFKRADIFGGGIGDGLGGRRVYVAS